MKTKEKKEISILIIFLIGLILLIFGGLKDNYTFNLGIGLLSASMGIALFETITGWK